MGQEQSIRDKIVVVAEADLERRKCLLVILQRIHVLSGPAVRQTESRDGHNGMGELHIISIQTHSMFDEEKTYWRETSRFSLQEVDT